MEESLAKTGLFQPHAIFVRLWRHRALILRLARREIEARYRGSFLGLAWAVIAPLILLTVYTFVFSVVFKLRWANTSGTGEFALMVFTGIIPFNIFAECINRSPDLMLENVSYVKKVLFPLDIMPMVSLASALFNAFFSVLVLMVFYLFVHGLPPVTALAAPLALIPMLLSILGLTWFLSALGVYIRDLRQFIGILVMTLMFLSPIFYPLTAVPEGYRSLYLLNPVAVVIVDLRGMLFAGEWPDLFNWATYLVLSALLAHLGYLWFMKTREGFADVV